MEETEEVKESWAGPKTFDIPFCAIFDWYYENLISDARTRQYTVCPSNFNFFSQTSSHFNVNLWSNWHLNFLKLDFKFSFGYGKEKLSKMFCRLKKQPYLVFVNSKRMCKFILGILFY